jgi:hypothetical protein
MRQNSPALSTWAVRILTVAFVIAAVISAVMVFNLVRKIALVHPIYSRV